MNVLFTSEWYPDNRNLTKGIFVKKHKDAIASTGVNLTVLIVRIGQGRGIYSKKLVSVSENEYELCIKSRFWKFIYVFYFLQKWLLKGTIINFLNDKNIEVIHSNVTHPNGVLMQSISKALSVPYLITEHHTKLKTLSHQWPFRKGIRRALENATVILPVSQFLKEEIDRITKHPNIFVVPNVIDSKEFEFNDIFVASSEDLRFFSVGSWEKMKGNNKRPDLIIGGLNLIAHRYPTKKVILKHAGKCSIQEDLLKLVDAPNLSLVFLGQQTPEVINEELNRCDRFLHATDFETFCVVAVEAQKSGAPFIISDVPPVASVTNEYGAIFTNNSIEEWFEAIDTSLNTEFDRKRIAMEAQSAYNPSEVGNEIVEIYSQIVKGRFNKLE